MRKILRTDETDLSYGREHQPMPRIGPWQERLDQILSANAKKLSRERLARSWPQASSASMNRPGSSATCCKPSIRRG
jgi:hypothetical protein